MSTKHLLLDNIQITSNLQEFTVLEIPSPYMVQLRASLNGGAAPCFSQPLILVSLPTLVSFDYQFQQFVCFHAHQTDWSINLRGASAGVVSGFPNSLLSTQLFDEDSNCLCLVDEKHRVYAAWLIIRAKTNVAISDISIDFRTRYKSCTWVNNHKVDSHLSRSISCNFKTLLTWVWLHDKKQLVNVNPKTAT